jgi:short-subunit dehydrogenase
MKIEDAGIILTGAAGGIGSETARQLAGRGARLVLLGRNAEALAELSREINSAGGESKVIAVDLLDAAERNTAIDQAVTELGSVDVLLNNAGLQSFRPFAVEDPEALERIVRLNMLAPMSLTRRVLPAMLRQGRGHIVNVGSTFGSIGFSCFTAYSASKFGLRGFSEALRRELADTGVKVTYVAPRAVKTKLNTDAVYRMADEVKMNMDEPEWVAGRIVASIEKERKDVYLGFPESLFVRINALLPRLVDGALHKQNSKMLPYAKGETP